jgi:DNA-binding beta-propeller fold protein YncE
LKRLSASCLGTAALLLSGAVLTAQQSAEFSSSPFHIRPVVLFSEHLYEGAFESPMGICFDSRTSEVWVADAKNNLIGAFTTDGVPLFTFRGEELREPSKIAVDPKGRVYVLDNDRSRIKTFSYRGEPLGDAVLPGLPAKPSFGAIAIDPDGNLYVGENETCQVRVYAADGKARARFGECGIDPGQFQAITGIAVTKDSIVVTDAQAVSVQIFDRRGTFVRGFGKHDMGVQNFSLPQSVAVDSLGRVIAIDTLRHEIKFFDSQGNFLTRFGGLGWRLGQVAYPTGIAIDSSDRLYVVEKGNARVQVFIEVAGRIEDARDDPPASGNGAGNVQAGRVGTGH